MGKTFPLLISIVIASAAGSCNRTVQEACSQDLAKLQGELARANTAFAPTTGRAPASLKEGWQDDWKEWAHAQLKLAQVAMDAMDEDTRFAQSKRALGEVANGFVEAYALAEQGRVDRFRASLIKLQTGLENLKTQACPAPPCPGTGGSESHCAPAL